MEANEPTIDVQKEPGSKGKVRGENIYFNNKIHVYLFTVAWNSIVNTKFIQT